MAAIKFADKTREERLIIGHNIPFDLGALSTRTAVSNGARNHGALSLRLCNCAHETCFNHPNVVIKKVAFGKHLFSVNRAGTRGNSEAAHIEILDTMMLGRALLGPGPSSLAGMAKRLNLPAKTHADYDGPITDISTIA